METQKRIRHALVNTDNKVINVIVWNGNEWLPPANHFVVQSDTANIGDTYDPITHEFSK